MPARAAVAQQFIQADAASRHGSTQALGLMSIATAIGLILITCAVLLYLPLFTWRAHFKRGTGPTLVAYSLVGFGWMLGLGLLGLIGGFFGPLMLPNDAQGPMLAFAATPLGMVIGMLVTWGWFYALRNEPSQFIQAETASRVGFAQALGGMREILIALAVTVALSSCARRECELCGHWRSNAERTLSEMEKSPLLSEKQRQFFRNDFYGHLVVETRKADSRAYFPDQAAESTNWEPWQVVSRSGNSMTVRESIGGETVVRSITLDGDCYRVDQPNLGFGEWFCRSP